MIELCDGMPITADDIYRQIKSKRQMTDTTQQFRSDNC